MEVAAILAMVGVIGGCVCWLGSAVLTNQLEEDYFFTAGFVILLALAAFVVCLK